MNAQQGLYADPRLIADVNRPEILDRANIEWAEMAEAERQNALWLQKVRAQAAAEWAAIT